MDNGFITFTEKDWEKASIEQQKWFIFNTLQSMDNRLRKLERWLFIKTMCVFTGSAIGGALMILTLVTLKIKIL